MPRKAEPKGPMAVSKLKEPGLHFVGTVDGLALQITAAGAKSWILRVRIGTGGKRREMGLGSYPSVTLAQAHELARQARSKARAGVDPVAERQAAQIKLAIDQANQLTFKQCAEKFIDANRATWKNAKHEKQWSATLKTYAYPIVGGVPVQLVSRTHVLQVLEPIWKTKTETASRVRGRMEQIFGWAIENGHFAGLNPARWKDNLAATLPARNAIAKVEHHAAMNRNAIPEFLLALRQQEGTGARALEFLVYTAARSGEVRGATWSEIDLDGGVWTIPAERMKAEREHRVPLSIEALDLLSKLPRMVGCDLLFPSATGKPLSDMTISAVMRRMKLDAVPHGFRSTFKDWAAETTDYPNAMSEIALAHKISNETEAAYRRGDMFEKRRAMMQDWAKFCTSKPANKVVQIRGKGSKG